MSFLDKYPAIKDYLDRLQYIPRSQRPKRKRKETTEEMKTTIVDFLDQGLPYYATYSQRNQLARQLIKLDDPYDPEEVYKVVAPYVIIYLTVEAKIAVSNYLADRCRQQHLSSGIITGRLNRFQRYIAAMMYFLVGHHLEQFNELDDRARRIAGLKRD